MGAFLRDPFGAEGVDSMADKPRANPRYRNGALRRKNRARIKALGYPCYLCGRPINYDEPSDYQHQFSFVIDEVIPVSRWQEFGYASPEAVANDFNNLRACHYICNANKSNRTADEVRSGQGQRVRTRNVSISEW